MVVFGMIGLTNSDLLANHTLNGGFVKSKWILNLKDVVVTLRDEAKRPKKEENEKLRSNPNTTESRHAQCDPGSALSGIGPCNVPLRLRLVKLSDQNVEHELLAFKFDAVGQYALYLDGKLPNDTKFKMQIPIKVGTDWKDQAARYWPQALVFIFIVLVLSNWKRIFG